MNTMIGKRNNEGEINSRIARGSSEVENYI